MELGREKQDFPAGFSCSLCTCQQPVSWELTAQAAAHEGIPGVGWFSEAQLATSWGNTPAAYQPGSSCVLSSREIQLTCFLLRLAFLTSKSITWKTFKRQNKCHGNCQDISNKSQLWPPDCKSRRHFPHRNFSLSISCVSGELLTKC